MRHDIEFDADHTTLRGWLYIPDDQDPPYPAVVMAHGFAALKEMGLPDYASCFVQAGLSVLAYDNRNFGESDGEPRQEIDPIAQMRDYRHAITFLGSREEIDSDRIGVWGTSYTGGLVLQAAALDPRIGCVVSQVPFLSGWESMRQVLPLEGRRDFFQSLIEDREKVARGCAPSYVSVCNDDPVKPEDAPGRLTYQYFTSQAAKAGVAWENRVTTRSLDLRLEYEALPFMSRVSPTPLLMIVAEHDTITPTDIALRAYEQALEPKQLLLLPGGHYEPYVEHFEPASTTARDWFERHLCGGPPRPFG